MFVIFARRRGGDVFTERFPAEVVCRQYLVALVETAYALRQIPLPPGLHLELSLSDLAESSIALTRYLGDFSLLALYNGGNLHAQSRLHESLVKVETRGQRESLGIFAGSSASEGVPGNFLSLFCLGGSPPGIDD